LAQASVQSASHHAADRYHSVLAAVGVGLLLLRRHLKYKELREDLDVEFGPHWFAFKDLYKATVGFKDKRLLGAGGFGSVYMGIWDKRGGGVDRIDW
jgi:hypothetical protein